MYSRSIRKLTGTDEATGVVNSMISESKQREVYALMERHTWKQCLFVLNIVASTVIIWLSRDTTWINWTYFLIPNIAISLAYVFAINQADTAKEMIELLKREHRELQFRHQSQLDD